MYKNIKNNLAESDMWIAQDFRPPTMPQLTKLIRLANDRVMKATAEKPEIHITLTFKGNGGGEHPFRIDFTKTGMTVWYRQVCMIKDITQPELVLSEIDSLVGLNVL